MADKITVIRIAGDDEELFRKSFAGYVSTGEDDSSQEADFRGSLDRDGRFFIVRKGHGDNRSLDYEARMTGTVGTGGGETVVEYTVTMSPVFRVCFFVLALLWAGFSAFALVSYFSAGNGRPLMAASFFTIAFAVMLVIFIVKPDCRAVEKCLERIASEYASVLDAAEKAAPDGEDAGGVDADRTGPDSGAAEAVAGGGTEPRGPDSGSDAAAGEGGTS
jgi:hypothetical protein